MLATQPVGHIGSVNASKIQVLNTQISYRKHIKKGYHHLRKNYLYIKTKIRILTMYYRLEQMKSSNM